MMTVKAWLSLSFVGMLAISSPSSAETDAFVIEPSAQGNKCQFVSELVEPFTQSLEGKTFPIILKAPWNSTEARTFKDLDELRSYLDEIGVEVVDEMALMTLDIRPDRVMVFASRQGSLRALCG